MEITLDSRFVQYLELRNRALKKREPTALYQLAQVYSHMNGKDAKRKAYELYKISAAFGYAEAQFMMGVCCENGTGIRRSEQMAIMWYLRAEISAASDIADHSEFVEKTEQERLRLYREDPYFAAEMDDAAYAQLDLQEDATIDEIAFAAEAGDPAAQDCLGHSYALGCNGLEEDYKAAEYWHRKSAQQGWLAGMHHLAQFYKRAERYREAAEWYRKFAELRIKQRKTELGW